MPANRLNSGEAPQIIASCAGYSPVRSGRGGPVTIKTADGRKFSGVALNQTSADLQLRSDDGQLRLIRREGQKFRGKAAGATILSFGLLLR